MTFAPVTDLPPFREATFGDFTYEVKQGTRSVYKTVRSQYSRAFTKALPPGNYTLTVTVEAGFQPTILGKDLMWNNIPGDVWPCSFVESSKTAYYLQGVVAYYDDVTGTASCTDPEGTGRVYRGAITDGIIMASEYALGFTNTWTTNAISSEDPVMCRQRSNTEPHAAVEK